MIFNQELKQWKQYFDVFVFFLGTICHLKKKHKQYEQNI